MLIQDRSMQFARRDGRDRIGGRPRQLWATYETLTVRYQASRLT
jgi:hypothetical protein